MTKHQIRTISPRTARFLVNSALCSAVAMLAQPGMAGTLPGIPGAANITVSTGGSQPLITFPDAVTLDIDLNAPRTVINWSSLHVSSGDTMNFRFDASSDIVLNKTTSQIAIDNGGTVRGTVGAATGGNIWFYSPQGVIVSPGAVMTAGGFLFSRGDSLNDAGFLDSASPLAFLRAATDALIQITTISSATSASINGSGDVVLSASSGALNVATAVGGTVQISTTSGSITASEVTATSGMAQVEAGGPGATVTLITGATGALVSSASNSSVGSATTTNSGDIVIQSSGSVSLTLGNSARDVILSAPLVFTSTIDAARDVFVTGTTGATVTNRIFAGDDIEITATGNVSAGGAYLKSTGFGASDDAHILVRSTTGSVSANYAITEGTGAARGDVIISGVTTATVNTASSTRDVMVSGAAASLTIGDAARDIFVSSTTGNATVVTSATAGDDVEVTAVNGNVMAGGATLRSTGVGASDDGHVLARSTSGSVAVGTAQTQGTGAAAGDVTINAGTSASLGSATSSRDLNWVGSSSLTLTGNYNAARTASLSTIGSITQSAGSLTAATLNASAQGSIDLGQINNVGSLGTMSTSLGSLNYRDADNFTLTAATTGQTVSLISDAGAITQSGGPLTAATLTASAANGIVLTNAGNSISNLGYLNNSGTGNIAVQSSTSLILNGDISAVQGLSLGAGGSIFQISGGITARSLSAQAVGGIILSAAPNFVDSLDTIQNIGSGNVTVANSKALAITGSVTSPGDVSILTFSGAISTTSGSQVEADGDITLTGAAGFSGAFGSLSGQNVAVSATTGDALVGAISTFGGDATVEALQGAATLRNASVVGGVIRVTASGTATLGSDSLAANVISGDSVSQLGSGIYVTSSDGDARVFLHSLNSDLTSVSANTSTGTASIGVAGDFTVGSVSGRNVVLDSSSGTINAASISVAGGDYAASAQDWAGAALNPGGTIRNLSIVDTDGGLVLANALTVSGDLTLSSSAGIDSAYDLTAGGDVSVMAGGNVSLTGADIAAGQTVNLRSNGMIDQAGGTITAQTLSGEAVGGVNLGGANQIAQLGDFTNVGGVLLFNNAGALTITGAVSSTGSLVVRSHGGMTFASTGTVLADGAGDAVVLASDGAFVNGRGADAVTVTNPAGRWLIYTQAAGNPAGSTSSDNFGGLSGKNFYGSAYDFAAGTFSVAPNAGNRFVHAYQPTLTVTPVSLTVTYDGGIPTLSSTITGLVNGDLAADAWSGSPTITGGSKNAGIYTLTATAGGLASDLNYAFAFGTGTLQINRKALTVTALDAFKDIGQIDPALAYRVSTNLVPGDAFTGALAREAGETSGSYGILPGTLSLSPNYDITFVGATFTVRQVPANDPSGSAMLKYLLQSPDFNLNWDPARNLTTGSGSCSGENCQS